jgi:hypothetical protein
VINQQFKVFVQVKVKVPCNRPEGPERGRGIAVLFLELQRTLEFGNRASVILSVLCEPFNLQ